MSSSEKEELIDMLWEEVEKENYLDKAEEEDETEIMLLQERLKEYKLNSSTSIRWNHLKDDLSKLSND